MTGQRVLRYGVVVVGLCYLVLAFAGSLEVSDKTNFGGGLHGGNTPDMLWGVFGVNTAMNLIHLLLGAFTIIGGLMLARYAMIAWAVVGAFAVLFGYGVIAILVNSGTTSLAITWGDNILHLVTAVVVAAAAVAAKSVRRTSVEERAGQR